MQAMIRQHRKRIEELQQITTVSINYQRTCTSRSVVLRAGVSCRVPFLPDSELLVVWCPIEEEDGHAGWRANDRLENRLSVKQLTHLLLGISINH